MARGEPEKCESPALGIFGNGLPEILLTPFAKRVLHVDSAPLGAAAVRVAAIEGYIEPFVEEHVRNFLHRLFAGHFERFSAIAFSRDDAAALAAYQYARELVRLGHGDEKTPRLLLWNLVHTSSEPASAYNRKEAQRLWSGLTEATGREPDFQAFKATAADEAERAKALDRLLSMRRLGRVSGAQAMRWRNAGRYTSARRHSALLNAALDHAGERICELDRMRIGLVGSRLDADAVHAALDACGTIVAELQPLGDVWPVPGSDCADLDMLLKRCAEDPYCHRIVPPQRYRQAIVQHCAETACQLVVCQLQGTDDTFGWEIPQLSRDLRARGIDFVNFGFPDDVPLPEWIDGIRERLQGIAEAGA